VYRFRGWRYSLEGPSFGYALIVAAMLYMLLQLFAGRPRRIPANADLNARIALFRCELGREHDFHGGYWFWSRLVIMTPGFILLCVGGMIAHPSTTHSQVILLALFLVFSALSIPNNLIRARSYARQPHGLDRLDI
jgi:thiosulfate reductase cytochrome b subunit